MNRISDERLDRLIEVWGAEISGLDDFGEAKEITAILRELRDYRKAVREYFSAIDSLARVVKAELPVAQMHCGIALIAAEANLRALAQPEE